MRFVSDPATPVREIMTRTPLITAPVGVSKDDALGLLRQHKIEKLPIVDAGGKLRGLITVKDFTKSEQYPNATKDDAGPAPGRRRGRASARTATSGPARSSTPAWTWSSWTPRTGTSAPCSRWSPGSSGTSRIDIVGGNIATYAGAKALVEAGADGGEGGRRPGRHLHHPGRGRGRRTADHRDHGGGPGLPARPACR